MFCRRFQLLKLIIAVINIVMVLARLALYENIFSLCAVLGAILQTGAFWITDERKIRLVSFFGAPMWLLYNTVNHAYGSAIGSVLSIISIGIAILRYDILIDEFNE